MKNEKNRGMSTKKHLLLIRSKNSWPVGLSDLYGPNLGLGLPSYCCNSLHPFWSPETAWSTSPQRKSWAKCRRKKTCHSTGGFRKVIKTMRNNIRNKQKHTTGSENKQLGILYYVWWRLAGNHCLSSIECYAIHLYTNDDFSSMFCYFRQLNTCKTML